MKTRINDPFVSLGVKVDIIVFLLKIGLLKNEHEKMFDL